MKKFLFLAMLAMVTCAGNTFAVMVTGLYKAEVPVAAQTDAEKEQAVRLALTEVLTKLTGNPDIEKNPNLKEIIQKASYYVQDYGYAPADTASAQYLLRVTFEKNDLNRLLQKAGIAYWGEERPLVLVWLTIDKNNQPEIIGNEGGNFISMMQQGKKYGLPLIFPVMDMDDMSHVTPDDVLQMTLPVLQTAAKRYSPNAILIGSIRQNKDGYQGDWQLNLGENKWNWTYKNKSLPNLMDAVLNQTTQTLSKNYVVKVIPTIPSLLVTLEISGLNPGTDYEQFLTYVKQLKPVKQVDSQESRMDANGEPILQLTVNVRGTFEDFLKTASINQHLFLKSKDEDRHVIAYQWVN